MLNQNCTFQLNMLFVVRNVRPSELWDMTLFYSDRVSHCSLIVAQFTKKLLSSCMLEIIVNAAMTIKRVDLAIMIIGVIMMLKKAPKYP